jgi:hypothetical protein
MKGKQSWFYSVCYPEILLGEVNKDYKSLNQDIQSLDRNLNVRSSEDTAGVLTTEVQYLVYFLIVCYHLVRRVVGRGFRKFPLSFILNGYCNAVFKFCVNIYMLGPRCLKTIVVDFTFN